MLKILALSTVLLIGVRGADVNLIFNEREIVVNPGDQLNLDCGVQGESRYCIWEIGSTIYQVEDVYTNVYAGFSKPAVTEGNECGITINSANIEQHGSWTCKVFVKGNSLVGTKNVIVTIKPTHPILEVETGGGAMEISNEIESDIKCSVAAARPAVGIRWFLGNRDVSVFAETEETPTDEGGIYKSVSTLRKTFEPMEDGHALVCSISHQTLPVPENASVPISVIYKPIKKALTTYYQIIPGSDYEVRFNFSANPVPTRTEWRYGASFQNIDVSISVPGIGEDGRYTTNLEELGDGLYTAKLSIAGFTVEDAKHRYVLVVENRLGETQYEVQLSMDEAPIDGDSETRDHDKIPPTELSVSEDTLSGGAVAGIIIVVLIVVLAVVASGYARYRQMFCFAPAAVADPEEGKDIKEEHDTESARGPNTTRAANLKNSIGKLTQVFKKPKKEQDTKLEEGIGGDEERKYLTKEEQKKDIPKTAQSPDDKEVVYAELDLSKGEGEKKSEVKSEDKTEYAQIIGTVTDNKEEEKKE